MSISAFAADTTVKGYLVDLACAREEGQKNGFGASHGKDCLHMPDCVKSGYGILTKDKQIIMFDKAGNDQAKKFIADVKKAKDIKVKVTGAVTGTSMTVSRIDLE
jgi:hypothetical protein